MYKHLIVDLLEKCIENAETEEDKHKLEILREEFICGDKLAKMNADDCKRTH